MPVRIREIQLADADAISQLSAILGYSIDRDLVQSQVSEILEGRGHFVFVASQNDRLVGYIHSFRTVRLTSTPFMEIAALVVHPDFRRKGIAKSLIDQVARVVQSTMEIRVRCNVKREGAHKFYESLGFQWSKSQKVFCR